MTKFTQILSPANIRQGVIFSSKKRLFESIAHTISDELDCKKGEQACFENLFNREKLGTSGLGNGIAMPKGKLPEHIDRIITVFMQLAAPLDYNAADGKDVDLIFAVLVPSKNCTQYIPMLAELTEKFQDKALIKQLRSAKSADEIWQIFDLADNTGTQRPDPSVKLTNE